MNSWIEALDNLDLDLLAMTDEQLHDYATATATATESRERQRESLEIAGRPALMTYRRPLAA